MRNLLFVGGGILVTVLISVTAVAFLFGETPQVRPQPFASDTLTAADVVNEVNIVRYDSHVHELATNPALTQVAQEKAATIAATGVASSQDSAGGELRDTIKSVYPYRTYFGWILSQNASGGTSTVRYLQSLLDNKNDSVALLNPVYRDIGVGLATDKSGHSVVVVLFGTQ